GAGGGVRGSQVEVSIDFAKEKLDNLIEAGVDCIIDVCSFCHLQYETAQEHLNRELGEKKYNIPVLYYTQLLGLAMGLDPTDLGLDKHVIDTKPLLDKILD
ncbi:MAG: heterodisulfide reductase-related iron-sulfur binding cluster, partial [Candidatus Thorarchaeota archaeon]